MSIFDEERRKMGIPTIGGDDSPSPLPQNSIFAEERARLLNPPRPLTQQEPAGEADSLTSEQLVPAPEEHHGFLDTLKTIGTALNYPFAKIAEYATPDSYLPRSDGSGNADAQGFTSPREALKAQHAQTSGNETFDKVSDVIGQLAGPLVAMQGMPASVGNLPGVQTLSGKAGGLFKGLGGRVTESAVKGAADGAYQNVGGTLATTDHVTPGTIAESAALGAGLGGGLGVFGKLAGEGIASALERFKGRPAVEVAPEVQQATQEILGLPEPKSVRMAREAESRSVLPPNDSPIYGQGDIHTFELPEPTLPKAITDIKETIGQRITPPYENPNELAKYVRTHLGEDVPLNEVRKLSFDDLSQLADDIYHDHLQRLPELAQQVAKEKGYNWDELIQGRAVLGNAAAPMDTVALKSRIGRSEANPAPRAQMQTVKSTDPEVEISQPVRKFAVEEKPLVTELPKRTETTVQTMKPTNEPKFVQTVKESPHTAPDLVTALNEKPMVGARTSDILNRQEAAKLIERHGREGLYSKLMAKTKQFSASETTAAQVLAKHFSSLGGEENLSKAIDLVSKTAKGGREMGQAIQALSQWNKLDAEGALLLSERQLNRGIKDTSEWKKLTPAQGAPITEAAQRIGSAQEAKSLADEVLNIVTNKQSGEALTEAEKATIKQFQDQVKMINEKGKGILSKPREGKSNATIKEVTQIEPKKRTRDQVVSFLDAKAEKARQRLAKSRNIGITPNLNNPVFDYAIIGASHIAKGVVTLSDFTEAMVRDFGEEVKPRINEVFAKATNIFRKENGLPTVEELDRVVNKAVKEERFTKEDAARFKAWAAEIGYMSDEFKREATQDLQAAMKDLGDSTLGEKGAAIHTSGMLLNAVTFERNILGNISQLLQEKANKVATVPVDWTLSKLTGEQRTIYFKSLNQEKFWKDFWEGTKSGWRGVSPSGTLDSYGIHPNVFGKKNPFKYVTKALGASLQGFDYAFYNQARGEVLATYAEQLGRAKGLTKEQIKGSMKDLILQLDDRIHELADYAGQYATYQDETMLSKGAEMLKKGLNEASTGLISRKLVDLGMSKKLSMEGFGAGDIVVKFAKTPANLIMRGLDYSPIGFIRGLAELAPLFFNRAKFNQFKASRALGRAITGSLGFTGMGFVLADAGILTGSASMDKDVRSIQEQSGQGAYKVNWSALGRFIMSGLDYGAAKYQPGDKLMDYSWLQPAAISVAMGVNAQKAWSDRNKADAAAGWQRYGKALLGGLGTVLENPMVQGVSQLVDATTDVVKKQDPTKFYNIGKGVPASFVPTLSNQLRAATDNNQRETYDKNLLTEMGNLMKNKVPGLSKTLPIAYDSMGHAREKIQGGQANTIGQYLTSFFSPAKITEYQVSPEAKIVLDLMNQSGDQNVLPRISDRYIHISQGKNQKDLRVDLTAEQYSQLQHNVGQMVTKKLADQANYLSNPSISMKNKVDRVKAVLTDVGTKAREDIGTQMGYKKKDVKK